MITIRQVATAQSVWPDLQAASVSARTSAEHLGRVEICGWVLGRTLPVVTVEIVHEGSVIARAALREPGPDIAMTATAPDHWGASASQFSVSTGVAGMDSVSVEVYAVLADQTRVPIGRVRVERTWDPALSGVGAPLVSVVIPCFDSSRFLADAIDSVLSQTYPHVEIIVVDDGSHDNAAAIVRRYPGVIYLAQPNRGVAAARNAGLDLSVGSHVVFLDADDRLRPEALEAGLAELGRNPTAAFVSGQCVRIDDDGRPLPPAVEALGGADPYQELLRNCYIWTSAAVMFRRWVFVSVGGFDSALSHSADHDLFFRIARRFTVGSHGHVVAEYRRHGGNMTRDAAASLRERMTVLRRQRPFVARGPVEWGRAYRDGIAFGREYYGTPLIARVVSDAATGAWRAALHGFVTLLRCYRRGALEAFVWMVRQIPLANGAHGVHEA